MNPTAITKASAAAMSPSERNTEVLKLAEARAEIEAAIDRLLYAGYVANARAQGDLVVSDEWGDHFFRVRWSGFYKKIILEYEYVDQDVHSNRPGYQAIDVAKDAETMFAGYEPAYGERGDIEASTILTACQFYENRRAEIEALRASAAA